MKAKRLACLAMILSSAALSSCNVFDPFDSPTSDAQHLSAARACFDKGDLTCANEQYSKLSGTSFADTAAAEGAFAALDNLGIGMGPFASALFANGSTPDLGKVVTQLANTIAAKNVGESTRREIFRAYVTARSIASTDLRGFAKFVTTLGLLSELMAEASGSDKKLQQADLVTGPTACKTTGTPGCLIDANCAKPSSTNLATGSTIDSSHPSAVDETSFQGANPTLNMINFAAAELKNSFDELQSGKGKLGSSGTSFTTALLAVGLTGGAPDSPCFRWALVSQGIGE